MKIYSKASIIVLLLHFGWSKSYIPGNDAPDPLVKIRETDEANKTSPKELTGYHFARDKMTFKSALSYCKGKQMQLVKIEDKETNELVYRWAKRHHFVHYWINGNDKDSDKKRLSYPNWHPRGSRNYKNTEYCFHVITELNELRKDLPCDDLLNVICQPTKTPSYHFAKEKMSFERAESYCKLKQMQLVKIKDKETDQLVYDWTKRHKFGDYWINGNDKESEGVFVDSDKKRLTYFNWGPKQPDNYKDSEHCLHVYMEGLWNDLPCYNMLNVICGPIEREPTRYHFAKEKMSFDSAESYCKDKQMQLVKIRDKKSDHRVLYWAKRYNFGHYWINGNDEESEGVFVDSAKKRLTYFNWHPGEPNNYKNAEHCVHVLIDKNGLWNDLDCGNLLNVICEPEEILDYFGFLAIGLSDMYKSIIGKIKDYFP